MDTNIRLISYKDCLFKNDMTICIDPAIYNSGLQLLYYGSFKSVSEVRVTDFQNLPCVVMIYQSADRPICNSY